VPADRFLREGALARAVASSGGRYLTLDPRGWNPIGYQTRQTPDDWPLLAMQQGMVFGLDAAQGYDSIQLPRFWEMVRSFDPKPIKYNVSYFARAPPVALDLLGVSDVIGSAAVPPVPGAFLVTSEGRWGLYGLRSPPPLASLFPSRPSWRVVGSPEAALNAVTAPRFDPERTVVLEGTPSFAAPGSRPTPSPPSSVTTIEQGAQEIRLTVDASAPAIVLIRVPFDRSWRASVDGRAVTPLAADFVDQGIPVPPGHHAIELTYVDPSIGFGLAGSGIALLLLVASAVILGCRRRHGRDRTVDGAAITALSSLPV
jgi:hypothetical protein